MMASKRSKTQTYTKLVVRGDKRSLRAFRKYITNRDKSVELVSRTTPPSGNPTPEEMVASSFGDYDTKIVGWSKTHLVIEFWSYYDPLIHGMKDLSEKFPTLTFVGAYVTTLKATLGQYTIQNGECNHGSIDPLHSLEMKNFCCEWDEAMERSWFQLADNWVADMTGVPLAS